MTDTATATADLLKRAAEKLREHANAASSWSPPPWRHATGLPSDSVRTEAGWEVLASTYASASADLAKYAALMHPPVALALADLFELQAAFTEATPDAIVGEPLAAVARAILREDAA